MTKPPAASPSDQPAASFEWTRDPVVAVSKRTRNLTFPSSLLLREPTDAERARWKDGDRRDPVPTSTFTLYAGVTFLGAMTSVFALRDVAGPGQAPRAAPPESAMLIVAPTGNAGGVFTSGPFTDRETRKVVPALVHAAWMRVMRWLEADDKVTAEKRTSGLPLLFTAGDGYDAPEVAVLRLSEALTQRTDAGRLAYPAITSSIKWAKDGGHLGALHDYAVREVAAWPLVGDIRARVGRVPSLLGV